MTYETEKKLFGVIILKEKTFSYIFMNGKLIKITFSVKIYQNFADQYYKI